MPKLRKIPRWLVFLENADGDAWENAAEVLAPTEARAASFVLRHDKSAEAARAAGYIFARTEADGERYTVQLPRPYPCILN